MLRSLLFFLLGGYSFVSLAAKEVSLQNVRYLYARTKVFSPAVDIILDAGKIKKIRNSIDLPTKQEIRYVIPSFCDAHVTLGANSLGGQNDPSNIRLALKSFLEYGFTHILSVADGKWVEKWQKKIASSKVVGPDIHQHARPLLLQHKENTALSSELYYRSESEEKFLQEIKRQVKNRFSHVHLFYRYNPEDQFFFTPYFLRKVRLYIERANKTFLVSTFADESAILHSLSSGVRHLYHPIPYSLNQEITPILKRELHWSPMFMVYYILSIQGNKAKVDTMRKELSQKSTFFKSNYAKAMQEFAKTRVLPKKDTLYAVEEFNSYIQFFAENKSMVKNMYLSSGTGNLFLFPGIAGLQEFQFLLKHSQAKKSDLWSIPSINTCNVLGVANGVVAEGKEANLLVLKDNPIENPDTLYTILKVIKKGKVVIDRKNNRRRYGRK
ncbi:MAG: amidohydrolase family protein [Spirochaetota bacterium]